MPRILFLLPLLVLFACGGGGGGGSALAANTDPGTGTITSAVTITGTLSAAASKPYSGKSANLYAVSSWAGAALQVVDASGTVVGTGTVNADGSYSVSVPKGNNYFIRAQSGNLVLKAFVPSITANASVPVNTTTTAEVVVLASVLGVANVGDPAVNAATAIASVNITTVFTQIEADTGIPTLATALATEITNNYNTSATTATIGSASTSVTTTVTTISVSIPQSVAVIAVPSAPTGVGVTAGNAQAMVSWTAVTGAASYNVYYRTAAGVTTGNGTKVTGATSGGAITSLTNGTTYYFVVTAVDAGGESAVSSEVTSAPGAPSYVVASGGDGQVAINWNAMPGAVSYNVYYSLSPGVTTATAQKVTNIVGTSTTITGIPNQTACYIAVTAVYATGESSPTAEIYDTVKLSSIDIPINIVATAGDGQVTVKWDAVANAASYTVYYDTDPSGTNMIKMTGITVPTLTIGGLSNGTTYYFWVKAVNAGGESELLSSRVGAIPQTSMAGTPQNLVVVPGNGQATISWGAVPGATNYTVYIDISIGVSTASTSKITGIPGTSVSVIGLENGWTYYFIVTATGAGGESGASEEASTTVNNEVACSAVLAAPNKMVALVLGQSNASNFGGTRRTAGNNVYVFNNWKCYKAQDPLPGGDGVMGSPWTRLGDLLVTGGRYGSVVFILQAEGGTRVREWYDGKFYYPLRKIIRYSRMKGFNFTHILSHQGEADAKDTTTVNLQGLYKQYLNFLVNYSVLDTGGNAKFYVSHVSYCGDPVPQAEMLSRQSVRAAQTDVINTNSYAAPGPDTDTLTGLTYRDSGLCHFNDTGLMAHANLWMLALGF